MGLWEQVTKNEIRSLAVMGLAKNTGKTRTFNYIIEHCYKAGLTAGITSAGRDGERWDTVTRDPKPQIYAREGTLVVTARGVLKTWSADYEILKSTGARNALGDIVLVRVTGKGRIEISGPANKHDMSKTVTLLREQGADFILIDGAIDRMGQVSPAAGAEGCIMATGRALSADMDTVVKETVYRRDLFNLPPVFIDRKNQTLKDVFELNKVAVSDRKNIEILPIKTALGAGRIISQSVGGSYNTILLGGALTDSLVDGVLHMTSSEYPVTIVVEDATKIFLSREKYYRFINAGGKIEVIHPIKLIGITANPEAPRGGTFFEPEELVDRLGKALYPTPVFDIVRGIRYPGKVIGKRGVVYGRIEVR